MKKPIDLDILKIKDAIEIIQDIEHIGLTEKSPKSDYLTAALTLATLADNVRTISDTCKKTNTHIPWRDITSLGTRLVERGEQVDKIVINKVVAVHLPRIKDDFVALYESYADSGS